MLMFIAEFQNLLSYGSKDTAGSRLKKLSTSMHADVHSFDRQLLTSP
jgi:hypothetical protein